MIHHTVRCVGIWQVYHHGTAHRRCSVCWVAMQTWWSVQCCWCLLVVATLIRVLWHTYGWMQATAAVALHQPWNIYSVLTQTHSLTTYLLKRMYSLLPAGFIIFFSIPISCIHWMCLCTNVHCTYIFVCCAVSHGRYSASIALMLIRGQSV